MKPQSSSRRAVVGLWGTTILLMITAPGAVALAMERVCVPWHILSLIELALALSSAGITLGIWRHASGNLSRRIDDRLRDRLYYVYSALVMLTIACALLYHWLF